MTMVAMAILCAGATVNIPVIDISHGNKNMRIDRYKKNSAYIAARSDEQMITVNPILTCDVSAVSTAKMFQYAFSADDDSNNFIAIIDEYGGTNDILMPFMLPPGKYNFYFFFDGSDGMRCVARENVDVNADMDINASASEAIEHIVFKNVLPNGELPYLKKKFVDGKTEIEGNCIVASLWTSVNYKNQSFYFNSVDIDYAPTEKGTPMCTVELADIWTSPSQNLSFTQILQAATEKNGNCFSMTPLTGTQTAIVGNKASDYLPTIETDFAPSRIGDTPDEIDGIQMFTIMEDNNAMMTITSWYKGAKKWNDRRLTICPNTSSNLSFLPDITSIEKTSEESCLYGIQAPLSSYLDPGSFMVCRQQPIAGNDGILVNLDFLSGGKKAREPHPEFSFTYDDVKPLFGDNTPVTVFIRNSKDYHQLWYEFTGRYGELRTIDNLNHSLEIKADGKVVCSSPLTLKEFNYSEEANQTDGPWDISIVNRNMEVDGLEGCNRCDMTLGRYSECAIVSTPTVTMLQFKKNDGLPTDRFATPGDGYMAFTAGDFSYNSGWFDYSTLKEIKAEYSPYNVGEWLPMTLDEQTDKFFMPGFGAYYVSYLSQVSGKSITGWFDVKLTLVSDNGDRQIQTISPAFKIEELAGIPQNVVYHVDIHAEGNSIVAPAGASVYTITGQEMPLTGLADGIYIVRHGSQSFKVVIR